MSAALTRRTANPVSPAGISALASPLTRLALLGVLAVAAFTRLYRLDLIDFKSDEARIAGLALDVAQGKWPVTSITTSDGLFNPPLPVYLFGLPALFTADPAWQAALIGLLDVAAVALTFLVGRRSFNTRVGLGAAAFYAANAYSAIFARKLAGPFLQPVFSVLLLWCLLEIARGKSGRRARYAWGALVPLLAILVQLHLGALLLVPVLALLAWRAWQREALPPLLIGLAASVALFAPYLVYEASHQPDFLARLAGAAGGSGGWSLGGFQLIWVTLTSPGYGDLTGSMAGLFNAESGPALWIAAIAGLFVVGGLVVAASRWCDRRYLTLLLFVLLPPLLTIRHASGLQVHYFDFVGPAAFLLAGIGLDAVVEMWPWLAGPAVGLAGLLLATNAVNFWHFTQFAEQHSLVDAYGLPLRYQEDLFDAANQLAGSNRIVAAADGRDQMDVAGYFLRGRPGAVSDARLGLLLPAEGGVYVTFSQATPAGRALSSVVDPSEGETLPGSSDSAVLYEVPAPTAPIDTSAGNGIGSRWQDGLQLTSASPPRSVPGQLAASWRVGTAVDPSTLLFNQLLDNDGKQVFDQDAVPVPAGQWRPGDVVVSFTAATLPATVQRQQLWWSTGVYEDGGRRVPLENGDLQLRLARLKGGASPPEPTGLKPIDRLFAGAIRLDGYRIDAGSVLLSWGSVARVDHDYTVFVHAVGPDGGVLAQSDSQPEEGRYPTSLWDPGDSVPDSHALAVAPNAKVEVGLYDATTGDRVKLADGSDSLILPT